jgi:hypothetical protein
MLYSGMGSRASIAVRHYPRSDTQYGARTPITQLAIASEQRLTRSRAAGLSWVDWLLPFCCGFCLELSH